MALAASEGSETASLPCSVDDIHAVYRVHRLLPDDRDAATRPQPWPESTAVQNCLMEQLVIILCERVEAYDSKEAFEIVHRSISLPASPPLDPNSLSLALSLSLSLSHTQ